MHLFVFALHYTSVAFRFSLALLRSGMRPTQEVGQRSASFDWQHFFGRAGSSAIDSVFHDKSVLLYFFISSLAFFHLLPLLSALALSEA